MVLWVTGAAPAAAQGADPLKSAACGEAVSVLEAARKAPAEPGVPGWARLEQARRSAAAACLGAPTSGRPSGTGMRPPVAVAPIAIEPPRPAAALATPAPPGPAVAPPRAQTLDTCDGTGCWDASGRLHPHQGGVVLGPAGRPCLPQGASLVCP